MMIDYSGRSDPEINRRVAEVANLPKLWIEDGEAMVPDYLMESIYGDGEQSEPYDPCNNPSDAWPIIEEIWDKLMSLCEYDFGLGLRGSVTTIWNARMHKYGDNSLRSAMIVYLMMKDAEND